MPTIRKNAATVSQDERRRLRDAIIALNHKSYPGRREDTLIGGVTFWFKQDEIHQATHVHEGPAFLTWHREITNRFEALLQEIDPTIALHYWDWQTDPRRSPDGKGGFVNLFTPDFMGASNGAAGEPWLGAGFYNPTADPFRSDEDFNLTDNPFDPPRTLERQIRDGAPQFGVRDSDIIDADSFPAMRNLLESAHNAAHEYIGGTLGDRHRSFRDPFVFLLHSNVDRLFALWQRKRGMKERLDPEHVYGSEGNTMAVGRRVGILTPLEPWAGAFAPGVESGVRPARPWAPPENEHLKQENQKDSKHPSVVSPPHYDTDPSRQLKQFLEVRGIDLSREISIRSLQPPVTSLRAFMEL